MEKGTNKETKRRVIVVGSEGHYGVKTTSWNATTLPNIADYDDVIVETANLGFLLMQAASMPSEVKEPHLERIMANLAYVRDRLFHILKSKGKIYAICSKHLAVKYGATPWSHITNYDWLPLPVHLVDESGETINLKNKTLHQYFQFVERWSLCFEEATMEDQDRERVCKLHKGDYVIKLDSEVIAQNRYGRPIALSLQYDLYKRPKYGKSFSYENHADTSGSLVLLPLPTRIDAKEGINVLLEDLWGIQQRTPPPEGVDNILLPGELALKKLRRN